MSRVFAEVLAFLRERGAATKAEIMDLWELDQQAYARLSAR